MSNEMSPPNMKRVNLNPWALCNFSPEEDAPAIGKPEFTFTFTVKFTNQFEFIVANGLE